MALTFLITAGPTIEDIDPVRFISNRATGKLGVALAHAALAAGHEALLIHGPLGESVLAAFPRSAQFSAVAVRSAAEMHRATMKHIKAADVAIMNAAVADFTPVSISKTKLKKAQQGLTLQLKPTADILKALGLAKARKRPLVLIGFALETGKGGTPGRQRASQLAEARRKLEEKNADAIILDTPKAMGSERGDFTVIAREREPRRLRNVSKQELAVDVVRLAEGLYK